MNSLTAIFLMVNVGILLLVSRRWAPLPLLVGTCYIPAYLSIDLGPLHFTAVRVLVAFGMVRILARQERPTGGINKVDAAIIAWAVWMIVSGFFHKEPMATFIFRLGLVYDACGIYALIRCFCRNLEDIYAFCQLTAIFLAPLAMEMLFEKLTVHNYFSVLGGGETPIIREGKVRANGPFGHPILAGTAGAVCLPMMIGLWRLNRTTSVIGILGCFAIIFSSASSGPILSAVAGLFALYMWRYRHLVSLFQRLIIPGYIALDLYMKDPAYYIIARIDLAGGSTSWYRCRLIESAIEHISEWWLVGTDYTRHWMWVVVSWSSDHTDITSHYIQMGVLGGLPLLVLFIIVLAMGFKGVTKALEYEYENPKFRFLLWAFGASLFAHTATFVSVSYFDQSFVFLYLTLAVISSAGTQEVGSVNLQWTATQLSAKKETAKARGKIIANDLSPAYNDMYSRRKKR
jgi:hypothetical protein